jgi:hypothetical protein
MPYEEHCRHKTPSERRKIWRYVDFTKYVDMLIDSSLFFPNMRLLRERDPYEGSFYNFVNPKLRQHFEEDRNSGEVFKGVDAYNWNNIFVNCWHMNEGESAALWKLYMKSNEGIAIVSNVRRFKAALSDSAEQVYLSRISYNSKKRLGIPVSETQKQFDITDCALFKRDSFRHERELRAFVLKSEIPATSVFTDSGLRVKVKTAELVAQVVINPESPPWLRDLVERVSVGYGFNFEIRVSTLNKPPL